MKTCALGTAPARPLRDTAATTGVGPSFLARWRVDALMASRESGTPSPPSLPRFGARRFRRTIQEGAARPFRSIRRSGHQNAGVRSPPHLAGDDDLARDAAANARRRAQREQPSRTASDAAARAAARQRSNQTARDRNSDAPPTLGLATRLSRRASDLRVVKRRGGVAGRGCVMRTRATESGSEREHEHGGGDCECKYD